MITIAWVALGLVALAVILVCAVVLMAWRDLVPIAKMNMLQQRADSAEESAIRRHALLEKIRKYENLNDA